MTPHDGITNFIAYLRLSPYSPKTVHAYADQLKPFAAWLVEQRIDDLRTVTRAHIGSYQAHVRQEPIQRETQALRLRAVKRLYQYLITDGRLLLDPTEGVKEISRRRALPRPILGPREMKRLLAAPDTTTPLGIRDRALLEVFYATGVRVGELEKVQVQDVDRTLQTMHIRFAKGGTPRVVPLGHHAVQWLSTYLDQVRPKMVKARPFERALFVVRGGRPLGQAQTRTLLHRYCQVAHLRKTVTPHILRHSCATHLLRAGANLRAIQELLGHSRLVSTTIYTRVAPMEVKAMHQRYHPGNAEHAAD
ncbi:tyrosine-type recombinase/integrase [Dyella sp. S184]|uniref:tyrosine-type recombinase/integrase n=1 Tax=Dyella sp. S184 TaxID=1641862 RepID=UPI00131D96A1|nr:tyrosine-type recombinase/integrase [Dyella sp. S184]